MKQNIDNVFKEFKRELVTPLDHKAKLFNKLYALERSRVLGGKPKMIKSEKNLKKIKDIVMKLTRISNGFDYEDFLKYAIKAAYTPKYAKFPPLEKIEAKIPQFELVVKNGEIYKYVFWPTMTKNTGKIFDEQKKTYYGFYTEDLIQGISTSTPYTKVIDEVMAPHQRGTLKSLTRNQMIALELVLVSMIRYRDIWGDFITSFYKLWKQVKKLPIKEKEIIVKKEEEKEGLIYEI